MEGEGRGGQRGGKEAEIGEGGARDGKGRGEGRGKGRNEVEGEPREGGR